MFQTFNLSTILGMLDEESKENGYFFGIIPFINEKHQFNGPSYKNLQ